MPSLCCEVRNVVISKLEIWIRAFLQCKTFQTQMIIIVSLCSLSVVIAADGVLKVRLFFSFGEISESGLMTDNLSSVLGSKLMLVPVSSDLWLRCLSVPQPHNTHVLGWNFPMDGSRSYPESPCVWNLWHVFLWCGECASHFLLTKGHRKGKNPREEWGHLLVSDTGGSS